MHRASIELDRAYDAKYGAEHPEKMREKRRRYYLRHADDLRAKKRAYNKMRYYLNLDGERERNRESKRLNALKLRREILSAYGGKCACCGETEEHFLCIDHINGGGRKHRDQIGSNIYGWLKRNNYPEGFQILCHNCNMSKGFYGECPHVKHREYADYSI